MDCKKEYKRKIVNAIHTFNCMKCHDVRKTTNNTFIEEVKEKQGEYDFNFDKTEYTSIRSPLKNIKCNNCNYVFDIPSPKITKKRKINCPKCCGKTEQEKIMERIHKIGFDIPKGTIFHKNKDKQVLIGTCKYCGYVKNTTVSKYMMSGCKKCNSRLLSHDEVVKIFVNTHGKERYDYSYIKYKGMHTPVKIFCNWCNKFFKQAPMHHKNGTNCPHCCNNIKSRNENHCFRLLGEYLENKEGYAIKQSNRPYILRNKSIKGKSLEIDIIIFKEDEPHLYIEWNGMYWHTEDTKMKNDAIKKEILGDKLLQIEDYGSEDISFVRKEVDKIKKVL